MIIFPFFFSHNLGDPCIDSCLKRKLKTTGEWNKDVDKSGDTLVEKCCHFFDLFRLISGQEMRSCVSKVHRGLLNSEYGYDKRLDNPCPIIDSAYVILDFFPKTLSDNGSETIGAKQGTLGCLELCMFADGSRHQEEIVVTGLKGRLEAYLPENKVFHYQRPSVSSWSDKSQPPPREAIREEIFDCSDLSNVYPFADEIPQHAGHHYCSTAVEWKFLIDAIEQWRNNGLFIAQVSLEDGIKAVEMGMISQNNVTNENEPEEKMLSKEPLVACSTKSSDHLLNLAINLKISEASIRQPSYTSESNMCNNENDGVFFDEEKDGEKV